MLDLRNLKSSYADKKIVFGYNKKLNEQLVERVNTNVSAHDSIILSVNRQCNDLEDEIRKKEKDGQGETQLNGLVYFILSPLKTALAKMIESTYPDLNYTKREGASYMHDGNNRTKSCPWQAKWRQNLATELLMSRESYDPNEITSNTYGLSFDVTHESLNDMMKRQWPKRDLN